jgi:hypothetical protein
MATSRNRTPATVATRVLLTFTSGEWCRDMGVSVIAALNSPALGLDPIGCQEDPKKQGSWHGELRLRTKLTVTDVGLEPDMAALLDGDLARIGIAADQNQPSTVSLAVFLDMPRLEAARARLLTFPALQGLADLQKMDLGISFILRNDLSQPATLIFDGSTTEPQPTLLMPAGSTRTVALSADAMTKLAAGKPVLIHVQVKES